MLTRTWGRRGELAGVLTSSGPERFEALREVTLFPEAAGEPRRFEIESLWEHRGEVIFKFRGLDSISEAEPFEKAEVRVPAAERAALPEGEFYHSDLVGCAVVDRRTGEPLGTVTGCLEYGGPLLLEVERGDGSEPMLMPFARAICVDIDVAARRIGVDLPDGLKDL